MKRVSMAQSEMSGKRYCDRKRWGTKAKVESRVHSIGQYNRSVISTAIEGTVSHCQRQRDSMAKVARAVQLTSGTEQ